MADAGLIDAGEFLPEETKPDLEREAKKRGIGVGGWIAVVWMAIVAFLAVFGPMFAADPIVSSTGFVREGCGDGQGLPLYDWSRCVDRRALAAQRAGDSGGGEFTHLMGVDGQGRDVFSMMVWGTRTTMIIAFGSIVVAVLVGGAMGLVAGYTRGWVGGLIAGIFDVLLAFPQLILALAIVSFLNRTVFNITLTLAIVAVPLLGRITRASSLSWSEREFVMAARALGAGHRRTVIREVLPNVVPSLMSISLLAVGVVIVAEGSLSIIGLGVPAGTVSWGSVLGAGGDNFRNFPSMVFIPSIAISLTVMALNLLGDAIRRKFDVRDAAI